MKTFSELANHANVLMRARLRARILDALRATHDPLTAPGLAAVLGVALYPVRQEMARMLSDGAVGVTHIEVPEGRAYRPVEIGICEWCGLLDHHLVAGECPACAASVSGDARPAHARRVC